MISGSVDVRTWQRQFSQGATKIQAINEKVFKESVTILYKNIIEATPIGNPMLWKYPAHTGYNPGTLRASWNLDRSSLLATISNSQPYAERVEYGWSTQAPQGMLRKSIMDFSNIINQTANRYKI